MFVPSVQYFALKSSSETLAECRRKLVRVYGTANAPLPT